MQSNQPNNDLFIELLNMGFEEAVIKRALTLTNEKEKAIELIFSFIEDEKQDPQVNQQQPVQNAFDLSNVNLLGNLSVNQLLQNQPQQGNLPSQQLDYKQVFLVRSDLHMGVGKIAAQVGHAVLGSYQEIESYIEQSDQLQDVWGQILELWEECGQAKIVLKVDSQEQMLNLAQKAKEKGLFTYIVTDAGKTQVEPETMTVCAIGPGDSKLIDEVTKHLKLL